MSHLIIPLIERLGAEGVGLLQPSYIDRYQPSQPVVLPSVVTASATDVDGTLFTTASVTPAANVLHLLAVTGSLAVAETPASVVGNSITWTAVTGGAGSNAAGTRRTSFFYGFAAAPTAGTIAITFTSSHTAACWTLIQVPGGKVAAPRQATTTNANSTTVTGTLAALATPRSVHLYALGRLVQEDSVPPANLGWTELADHPTVSAAVPAIAMETAWAVNKTVAAPTWATSGGAVIVDVEVEAQL